jgi:amidophosphoribosyltransferase
MEENEKKYIPALEVHSFEVVYDDKPKDECAIFGIYNSEEAANFTYLGLYSMQHRGQESSGIVSTDGSHLYRYAGMGLVSSVFNQTNIKELFGKNAIGHNRYSTTGASFLRNAQPLRVESHLGAIALAHNGNLVNSYEIRRKLELEGSIFQTTIDSEVIVHLMAKSRSGEILESLCEALRQVEGAYSLLVLTNDFLIGVRDPNGFRPLVLGKRGDGTYVFASETCAFDITDTEYIRDVEPGELIIIDKYGLKSLFPFEKRKHSLCIFEYIYFSRPDSMIYSQSVYKIRKQLGYNLALINPVEADVVISVPDSANVAALGYSEASGIPFAIGLIRSHYIGRTFIEPDQKIRDFGAKIKYNVIREVVDGKRVIIVDDSIMRGTTSRKIVKMIRNAGAREIHMRISAPPTVSPCYYGIDIPTHKELIAATHTLEEIKKYLRVDSVEYLTIETMHKAAGQNMESSKFCDACFSGKYPIQFTSENTVKEKFLFTEMFTGE